MKGTWDTIRCASPLARPPRAVCATLLSALLALPCVAPSPALAATDSDGASIAGAPAVAAATSVSESADDAPTAARSVAEDAPSPFLRKGIHPDWQSRTVLPEYAQRFYDALVEGTDPTSATPYLIDPAYFNLSSTYSDGVIGGMQGYSRYFVFPSIPCSGEEEYEILADEVVPQALTTWRAFLRDHPEVFWLNGQFYYGLNIDGGALRDGGNFNLRVFLKGSIGVDVRLYTFGGSRGSSLDCEKPSTSQLNVRTWIAKRDAAVASILADMPENATGAEKVAYLSQWLCGHNRYNSDLECDIIDGTLGFYNENWDATRCLSALVQDDPTHVFPDPTAEGLAAAFKVLCDAAGIPCVIEDGMLALDQSPCAEQLKNPESESNGSQSETYPYDTVPHCWNAVEIDGLWYAVDMALNVAAYDDKHPNAPSPYLLVGSDTTIDGTPFAESHRTLNNGCNAYEASMSLPRDTPRYDNGPVLTNQAYAVAPYRFTTRPFDAGNAYGSSLTADPNGSASLSLADGATTPEGTWQWADTASLANDTERFFKPARYVDPSGTVLATALIPFDIERRTLTVVPGTVATKIYDGSARAAFEKGKEPQLTGVLPGDDVRLKADATFEDAAVGTEKDVRVVYRLMGSDAGHYRLSGTSVTIFGAGTIKEAPTSSDDKLAPPATSGSEDSTGAASKPSGSSNPPSSSGPSSTQSASRSLSRAVVTLSTRTYSFNGRERKPSVTVKLNGRTLRANTDYRVSYSGKRKAVGTYRVTVKGAGIYTGTKTVTFKIVKPAVKKTALSKIRGTKRALTLSWKKATGKVSGYQVQCSTDKKFKKNVKTTYVKGATKRSAKITGLKAKKSYYARVRTVYKVGGKTFYSPWSQVKKARTA